MTDSPLHICFLWHMHQPFYKHPLSGIYKLPWVRLHGTKDYLDMLEILLDFPDINDEEIESHPWRGYISIAVPTPDFEAMMWS